MTTIEIKNIEGTILFTHTCKDNTIKETLELAISKGTDLSYADLEGAKLEDANFENAKLSYANFKDADLNWVNFTNANLNWANLRGAKLSYAFSLYANMYPNLNVLM